jgi:FkbM family methyltransferase
LDIGANIGNHSIFYAQYSKAAKIVSFEANPVAASLLRQSVSENRLGARIDLQFLCTAIGALPGKVRVGSRHENNLGATQMKPVSDSDSSPDSGMNLVACEPIDALMRHEVRPISFMKIDVEGMELDVLKGAAEVINRHRPSIAVEVALSNDPAFWAWVLKNRYHCIEFFFDYGGNKNYCLIPMS